MNQQFAEDVHKGLSSNPKTLPSKYFYDKKGDALFVEIMNMPEYYLTRAEHEIFEEKTSNIIQSLNLKKEEFFELIELGSGDGSKTKELLQALDKGNYNFEYVPIDISKNAVIELRDSLKNELPNLKVNAQQGDYFKILKEFKERTHKKIVLFLGSNIGNMKDDLASKFIYQLGSNLHPKDRLLLGVDLIKSEKIVLPAYNDENNITKAFNINLLKRINNELGGDFNLSAFDHQPEYTEKEGIAKSFLVSLQNQDVEISATNKKYTFSKGEKIHTEISRKYNDDILNKIIAETDFTLSEKITDSKNLFADYILIRN